VKLVFTRDTARQFFRRCPVLGLLLEQPSDSFFGGMLLFPELHYTPRVDDEHLPSGFNYKAECPHHESASA